MFWSDEDLARIYACLEDWIRSDFLILHHPCRSSEFAAGEVPQGDYFRNEPNEQKKSRTSPLPLLRRVRALSGRRSSNLARHHTELALETLAEVAQGGSDEKMRLAAAEAILDRGWGKPCSRRAATREEGRGRRLVSRSSSRSRPASAGAGARSLPHRHRHRHYKKPNRSPTNGNAKTSQAPDGETAASNIRKRLRIATGYQPRPFQAELHENLCASFNVLVAHRRFGKTVFAVNELDRPRAGLSAAATALCLYCALGGAGQDDSLGLSQGLYGGDSAGHESRVRTAG